MQGGFIEHIDVDKRHNRQTYDADDGHMGEGFPPFNFSFDEQINERADNEKEQKELETYRTDRSSGMCLCGGWSDSWNQADQQRKQQNIRCSDYRISSRSDRDNPDTYNSERL